jgi:transposase-like protein
MLKEIKELMTEEGDFLRPLIGLVLQEVLEAEMSETLGAEKGERTEARLGGRRACESLFGYSPGEGARSFRSIVSAIAW